MTCEIIEGLEQGTPEWHAFRLKHRMASLSPALMGDVKWQTRRDVIRHYRGESKRDVDNPAMRWGREHEADARSAAAAELGDVLFPCVVRRGEYAASLDGAMFHDDGTIVVPVECKAPYGGEYSETFKAAAAGGPGYYRYQLQHQMWVTGAERMLYVVWTPGPVAVVWVKADPVLQETLRNAWDELMREVTESAFVPGEEWQFAADLWRLRKRKLAEAEREEREAREQLIELAPAGQSEIRGGGVILRRSEVRGAIDYGRIPELQSVDLDAYRKPSTQRITLTEED